MPGLWDRVKGVLGTLSGEEDSTGWPALDAEKARFATSEMPEQMRDANVQPMNAVERRLLPSAYGVTYPWGRVALNRPAIEANRQNLGDTLAHELTHVKQGQHLGMLGLLQRDMFSRQPAYLDRPHEIEAFVAEGHRPIHRRDIHLPYEAPPSRPSMAALARTAK